MAQCMMFRFSLSKIHIFRHFLDLDSSLYIGPLAWGITQTRNINHLFLISYHVLSHFLPLAVFGRSLAKLLTTLEHFC